VLFVSSRDPLLMRERRQRLLKVQYVHGCTHQDVACACDYSCSAQSTCGKWAAGLLFFTLILRSSQTCGEALDIDTLSTTSDKVEQTELM
jgi:hypothetical protein